MKMKLAPALLLCGDAVALVIAYFAGYGLGSSISNMIAPATAYIDMFSRDAKPWMWMFTAVIIAIVGLFAARGHYTQRSPWWEQVRYILCVCAAMLLLVGCILFALKIPFSRLWIGSCFLFSVPLLVIMRLIVRKVCLSLGQWGVDVTVVGGPQNALEAIYALSSDGYNVYRVKEIMLLGTTSKIGLEDLPRSIQNVKQVVTRADELVAKVKRSTSELIIIAPDEQTRLDLPDFMQTVQSFDKIVAFVPPMSGMSLYGMDMQHFFGSHTVLLKPKRRVESTINRIFKRTLDLFCATMGMIVLMVGLLFTIRSALVKTESHLNAGSYAAWL
jgi:hypothetical protein